MIRIAIGLLLMVIAVLLYVPNVMQAAALGTQGHPTIALALIWGTIGLAILGLMLVAFGIISKVR